VAALGAGASGCHLRTLGDERDLGSCFFGISVRSMIVVLVSDLQPMAQLACFIGRAAKWEAVARRADSVDAE
jgi:hypothetical protein